jgi:hypothetical protein
MEIAEARAVLGVDETSDWETVRDAYRRLIRQSHPDVAGPGHVHQASSVNIAYAVLDRARTSVERLEPDAVPVTAPAADVTIVGTDTIRIDAPAEESFVRLVEAAHRVGEVTYVDSSCAIFEAVVELSDGESYSLVVSLQGRADGTDAFCTLEALEHIGAEPVELVVAALAGQMVG